MNAILQPAPPDASRPTPWPPVWQPVVSGVADGLGTPVTPSAVPAPQWVAVSAGYAAELGWPADWATRDDAAALQVFAGNAQWPGMAPFASVYSGHQFGVWAGQLGDGRALSLGAVDTPAGPIELQLKGAGLTPYSRMGDGRAVLRSSIREFLCSEAMHALGIATTRALCVIGSPMPVRRERMETAAVVTRAAPSFLRFGHFEHFAAAGRTDVLRKLADHVVERYYPECAGSASPYAALLEAVALRTADMIAAWQSVGFCHGVMNTDNMSLLGLTIDYGPFGFLDAFDPGHICNHTDAQGRYAFDQQPAVGFWNLHALAHAMRPLIGDADAARQAIEPYKARYGAAYDTRMRRKLGLDDVEHDGDAELVRDWLQAMADGRVDHTIAFRRLADHGTAVPTRDLFIDRARFDAWALRHAQRLQRQSDDPVARQRGMQAVNPRIVLRNHLAETAIQRAEQGDFTEVTSLLDALVHPFDADRPLDARYTGFVPDWADHLEVSCSS